MTNERRFLFKLAGHLSMPVYLVEQTISFKELQEWKEYFNIEPQATDRVELMLSIISSILYNSNSKSQLSYVDFMISLSDEERHIIKEKELQSKIKSFFRGL